MGSVKASISLIYTPLFVFFYFSLLFFIRFAAEAQTRIPSHSLCLHVEVPAGPTVMSMMNKE